MLPPKLSLRPSDTDTGRPEAAAAGVDASELMAHEGWRGLPSNVAQLPSADRREHDPRRRAIPGG